MLTVVLGLFDYMNGLRIGLFWRFDLREISDVVCIFSAAYSALSKIAWGLGLTWIIGSCYYGSGGPINAFLSWQIWIPLGRMSYCVYLTHYFFLIYLLGLSSDGIAWNGFADLVRENLLNCSERKLFSS